METAEIARRFARQSLLLTEEALKVLLSFPDVEAAVENVLENLKSREGTLVIVGEETVREILRPEEPKPEVKPPEPKVEGKPEPPAGELKHKKFRPLSAEHEERIKILRDVTGKSLGKGSIEDFQKMFLSRFEKLSRMLRERPGFEHSVSIASLRGFEGERVTVIGMVMEKKILKGGTIAIELEDPTGSATVFASKKAQAKAEMVVPDEVIGVEGRVRAGKNGPRIFADNIEWPGAPVRREVRRADIPVSAVMISDLHIGSEKFLQEVFARFVRWLREGGDTERERKLASSVKYVVIAGDLVDGIGIYPEQRDELLIPDIYRQYEAAASILAEIPEHISIVIAPGNHDAVRAAEPQPALPKDVCPDLDFAVMVGNPALVSIEGVHFLIYHGRSFDDLVAAVPGATRNNPANLMEILLEKRHLAPIYGGRVMFAPELEDLLVIEEVPDVFHTGHVHICGVKRHKDVHLVNSGTFQERTEYMKKLGVNPTPGIVHVLNLMSHQLEEVRFL